MRWYNIKKYDPVCCVEMLIRAFNGHYEWHLMAMCENVLNKESLEEWEFRTKPYIDLTKYKVTHFCLIDPIEIEE
jgi:hypothetical protein